MDQRLGRSKGVGLGWLVCHGAGFVLLPQLHVLSSLSVLQDEDEWKDFEEEKKDYTNLKIQNLQITEAPSTEDGDGDDGDQMEENEAGEMVPRKKQPSGPWMNVQPQAPPEEPVRGLYSDPFPAF